MTLWRSTSLRIFLDGCDPGAQSCCPRSARDDALTDPDNGPDAVLMPGRLPDYRGAAAERRCGPSCSEVSGGNSPLSCAASTDKMVVMCGRW
jgi:hypothetical protein